MIGDYPEGGMEHHSKQQYLELEGCFEPSSRTVRQSESMHIHPETLRCRPNRTSPVSQRKYWADGLEQLGGERW